LSLRVPVASANHDGSEKVDAQANKRTEGRSNVFLTAALDTGTESGPVRIRNLSAKGALIEGSDLPPIGTKVTLLRGSLCARGEIVWLASQMAGVNFDDLINVQRWVLRTGHAGQQRVDGVVAALRRSESVPAELTSVHDENSLLTVSASLDRLCERLASTASLSLELGESLIELDAIAQSLRQLASARKA